HRLAKTDLRPEPEPGEAVFGQRPLVLDVDLALLLVDLLEEAHADLGLDLLRANLLPHLLLLGAVRAVQPDPAVDLAALRRRADVDEPTGFGEVHVDPRGRLLAEVLLLDLEPPALPESARRDLGLVALVDPVDLALGLEGGFELGDVGLHLQLEARAVGAAVPRLDVVEELLRHRRPLGARR